MNGIPTWNNLKVQYESNNFWYFAYSLFVIHVTPYMYVIIPFSTDDVNLNLETEMRIITMYKQSV